MSNKDKKWVIHYSQIIHIKKSLILAPYNLLIYFDYFD